MPRAGLSRRPPAGGSRPPRQLSLAGLLLADAPGHRPPVIDLIDVGKRYASNRQEAVRRPLFLSARREFDISRRAAGVGPLENDTRHSAGCAGHNSRRTPHRPWLENRAFGRRLRDDRRPLLQLLQTPVWAAVEQPGERSRPGSGIAVAI